MALTASRDTRGTVGVVECQTDCFIFCNLHSDFLRSSFLFKLEKPLFALYSEIRRLKSDPLVFIVCFTIRSLDVMSSFFEEERGFIIKFDKGRSGWGHALRLSIFFSQLLFEHL